MTKRERVLAASATAVIGRPWRRRHVPNRPYPRLPGHAMLGVQRRWDIYLINVPCRAAVYCSRTGAVRSRPRITHGAKTCTSARHPVTSLDWASHSMPSGPWAGGSLCIELEA